MKPIIVGYDPGATTAFAAFDLKGNFLTARAQKEWAGTEVAQAIREIGLPLVIAVDKKHASDSAEKFSARFGCLLWRPEQDLGVREKGEAVKEALKEHYRQNPDASFSQHEKDAMAAAIFAYKSFATQFSKIDDTLGQVGMSRHADDAKRMILQGEAKNINEALENIRKRERPEKKEQPKTDMTPKRPEQATQKVKELGRSLDIQKLYIEKLEKKVKDLEDSKRQLQEEQLKRSEKGRAEALESKEVVLRENMIRQLQTDVEALQKMNDRLVKEVQKRNEFSEIAEENGVALVPVTSWERDALAEADRLYRAKDRILWIREFSASNAATKYCIALRPKAVVTDCDEVTERMLRNAQISVVRGLKPQMRVFYGSAGLEEFERAVKGGERTSFLNWLNEYRNR